MLKKLNLQEMSHIYNTWMVKDFPSDELKPLNTILEQMKSGIAFGFGFYEEELCGYAVLESSADQKTWLLDYFAVLQNKRGQGIGGRFFKELTDQLEQCEALFIESEAADTLTAQRRIAFYQRCKARLCSIDLILYQVNYRILVFEKSGSKDDAVLYEQLSALYRWIYPPEFRSAFLTVSYRAEDSV